MFEFNSAVELISHAVSNSLFVFCFCNLIILMILVGSKKPKRQLSQISPLSMVNDKRSDDEKSTKRQYEERDDTGEDSKVMMMMMMMSGPKAESEDDRAANDNDGNVGDKEEDELRKRVEDFIEKVNKGWKAELLRTSHLV
ncbi:hypothetical protein L484_012978 [Morus notabilis]|uniref:DUF4408 domain-containing protein n=1 Tax=Morus notabilis TaxID=981085 RepID=W9SC05_9ROSA|nr:hypothetical protein L484_012978 [Morus notabilis]